MNRVLKSENIDYDPSIITVATDHKKWSGKHISNILFGLLWALVGIFILGVVIYFMFGYPGNWDGLFFVIFGSATSHGGWFAHLVLFIMIGMFFIVAIFLLMMGIGAGIFPSREWVFVLYPNFFLFRYKKEIIEASISSIESCYIMKKNSINKHFKTVVNIHLQYVKDEKKHFASLTHYDGYDEVNEIISYLQDEKDIPIYFTSLNGTEKKDLEELPYQKLELIEFNNDIKSYIRS